MSEQNQQQPGVDDVVAKAQAGQAEREKATVATVADGTLTDLKGNAVGHVVVPSKDHVFAQYRDHSDNEDHQKAKAFVEKYPDLQDRINAHKAATQPPERFDEAKARKVRAEQSIDR